MSIPRLEGKAIITGASGFIGGCLRNTLIDQGVDVIAIRRKGSPPARRGRSVELSYSDREGMARLVRHEKPDWVFHVAGVTKGVTYDDFRKGNVIPTKNLLDAVHNEHPDVKRFVHVSSLASYGPSTMESPHVETDERRPVEFYGESKLEAERLVEAEKNVPWTILRPGGVYGPGDVDYFKLFQQVERGFDMYFGNRKRLFSGVYVDDIVSAILCAATHSEADCKGYFVCDGVPVSWETFQREIVKASGRKVFTLDLPEFLVDLAVIGGELATKLDGKPRLFNRQKAIMGSQHAWTCKSDALRALGWKSQMDLERGVCATIDWYREHKWV
ncbi:MAG: NAD(P)-dependent oxidoreductase [Polyangiaceae bacterium]|nr:NAD(P)-dependent oxidoreductase [Polyangiaceae bacterium]